MKSTFQILCGVSTVRGLDIMKTAVRKHLDQYVKNVVWVNLITLQMLVKNEAKCVNCHKNHQSKSNQCEIWKKEKEIMKIKVTQKITYLEAKKIQEINLKSPLQKLFNP